MREFLILIIGESESGKSTIAEYISKKYNIPVLQSYTTRPRRKGELSGHIFVSMEVYSEVNKEDIVAETFYGGHFYYATKDQIKKRMIYVVDENGYEMLKDKYPVVSIRVIRRFRSKNARTSRDNFKLPPYTFDYILPNNASIEDAYEEADRIMERII